MRLTKLKLAGFKSFVDPTVVLTPGQLVGIVGPNGCGKSNLIDAVRWVLGETRASALRGESMQDVIFAGSTARKPVSRASVELVFDNADGRAAGQWSAYAEISVRRLVDRSGDSEYSINGVRVRRKDVIDLFLGTGLGPRAYAIIEQGMISRVIEARPEEVRAFLEEAAGVTKYKERRRETEGRLADARDNLARIEDISAELGQQVEKLSAQAELARRYKALSSDLGQRQVLLWRFKHDQACAELEGLQAKVVELAARIDEDHSRLQETEHQTLIAREQQGVLNEALNQAQADFYAIGAEVSRIEGEIRSLREARSRLSQRGEQLLAEEAQWQAREASLVEEKSLWEERRAEALEKLDQAGEQAALQGEVFEEAEAYSRAARERLEECRRACAQAEQKMHVAEARSVANQRALEALARRRERIEQERPALEPGENEALARLEAELESLKACVFEEEAKGEALQHAFLEAQEKLRQARQEVEHRSRHLTGLRARFDALRSLQKRLQDQGDLAACLRKMGLDKETPLWQRLQVEAGWELAVEAWLRERLSALGPVEEARLKACLAAEVPTSLSLLRETAPMTRPGPAFTGKALACLVRCEDPVLEAHVRDWLAGCFAVESLEAWLASGETLPPGVTLLTREGQALSAGELRLFAPDARTHGALERQREIEHLEAELEPAEDMLEEARAALLSGEQALKAVQDEQGASRQRLREIQASLHERSLAFVKAQQARANFEEKLARLAAELAEILRQEGLEEAHLQEAVQVHEAAESELEMLRERLAEAQELAGAGEEALRGAREAQTGATRLGQEAEFSVREAEVKLGDIERNLALCAAQRDKQKAEREGLEAEQVGFDEAGLERALQTALDLRRQREASLASCREALDQAGLRLKALEETRSRLDRELAPMRERINELRLASQAAELARVQATERLGELGAEVLPLAPEVLAGIKEASLSREVTRLSRELAELGPVNLAALVELEAARERKRYLEVQFQDLMGAIETLVSAIRRIDRETREQLRLTFETVNRHFGELFPRLFGGGEARLVMSGEEILDAGVQIIARPPGKKNSSIHFLSGGEKALTAIALVFAMFQLNPAPFCMLDEVDAPLDDANTERYCEMVRHMSAVTQFVFISHSKITMEMAHQLVGVTMQEQGVSRVVEVDISEAIKLAQPEPA